ncbi:CBS domain containing protein [Desulforamulus reducens MI-1]|uniref:CBS domain containing protein n=1 Tax=Desulforamulus reducens (strain ATCC BAA-1160 / DSM 100696 / MI-1) TaxID=349161 RepID=A4J4N6_DESRM|nr:CBS domain-containing protein [Desulforamulus reducens]ABO50039.1 CBS domain containing protein [Desulforamulus reducens MI-1]
MLQSLTARDVMIPLSDYATVSADDSIRHAIYTLRISIYRDKSGAFHGHRALIVLDNKGNVSGILTLLDLLKAVGLKDHYNDPWVKSASWSWFFINRIHESEGIKVKDIMRPIFLGTVDTQQPIQEVIRKMLLQEENLIPVLENHVPIGVIRTIDLFWLLGNLL